MCKSGAGEQSLNSAALRAQRTELGLSFYNLCQHVSLAGVWDHDGNIAYKQVIAPVLLLLSADRILAGAQASHFSFLHTAFSERNEKNRMGQKLVSDDPMSLATWLSYSETREEKHKVERYRFKAHVHKSVFFSTITVNVCLWRLHGCVLDFIYLSATDVAEIAESTHLKGCPHTFVYTVYLPHPSTHSQTMIWPVIPNNALSQKVPTRITMGFDKLLASVAISMVWWPNDLNFGAHSFHPHYAKKADFCDNFAV